MQRRSFLACLLFVSLAPSLLVGQADATDTFIAAEMLRQSIPGLSLVVIDHGKIIKSAGYGVSDRKSKTPATPETVYKIASVSKQFIAAGIMRLVEARQVALDDPVNKYLKDAPSSWSGITIQHLLTHTGGLVREGPGFDPDKVQPDADVIRSAYAVPLRFAPGEKWEYSNLGYFMLAEVITQVAHKHWAEYIDESIFKPVGMTSTYPTNTKVAIANRARGYVDNDELRDAPEWQALRPSGAFLSTVLDLAKWDAALSSGTLLADSTRKRMWTPVRLNDGNTAGYGFGWMLGNIKGHRVVHHAGGMPGARSSMALFPDDELTIILLMNLDDVDVETLMRGVADRYLQPKS